MASWTDNSQVLGSFNPYIEQLPAESLAQIGMIKQQQFDQGVQKVQGYVDQLSSLPIAKDEVKSYVQTKLGQLREGVTKNLAGDFSDSRITNQIGGAARIIARDPIVQNGVTSTARMQSSLAELQEAKKAGKSALQNEAHLQNSISSWINDGQLDSQFTGSYTPYTDVTERFIKLYKEQNPGEDISQDAYRYDPRAVTAENPEGKVINPVLFKGKGPAKIQSIFNIVASQPDVQQQLQIDGWYKYRGINPNQLGAALAENTNSSLKDIGVAVNTLRAKLDLGSPDESISAQIDQLEKLAESKKKSYESINSTLHSQNPEAAKTQLVKEELNSNLIGAYTYGVMEKSPLWETSQQEKVFQREWEEFKLNYNRQLSKDQWDMQMDQAKLSLEQQKLAKTKKDGSIGESGDVITAGQIVSSEIETGSALAYKNVQASLDEYTQSTLELAAFTAHGGQDSPAVLDNVTGQYKFNFGPGKTYKTLEKAMDAISSILRDSRDAYINGGVSNQKANELIEKTNQKWDNYQANNQIVVEVESQFKPKLDEIRKAIGNEDFANAYIVEQKLPGWQGIESSLKSKYQKTYTNPTSGKPFTIGWKVGMGIEGDNSSSEGVPGTGKLENAYRTATSKLRNDPSIPLVLQQREEAFSRRQSTNIPYVVTHDVSKSEIRTDINTRFNALAAARAVNPSTGKGDANEIINLTEPSDKRYNDNQYRSGINPQTGVAYIQIQRGTDSPVTLEISRAEYERQFPERKYNNQFRETFGARLNQTQWQSTDPLGDSNGGGRANAYKVVPDKPDFPYVVQYHLVAQGPDQYALRWWVTPKPSSTEASPSPIINGEYASGTLIGMPSTLSEEEVVKWKEKLKDSNWLKDQLLFKFRPKSQPLQ